MLCAILRALDDGNGFVGRSAGVGAAVMVVSAEKDTLSLFFCEIVMVVVATDRVPIEG